MPLLIFFFSSRRRHTRLQGDWSSDVCSSDLGEREFSFAARLVRFHRAHPLDQLAVSLGIAAVLVAGEELYPARDQLIEVARERLRDRNDLGRSREPLHPRKIDSGAPPP